MSETPAFARDYARPDLDAVRAEVADLAQRLEAATGAEQAVEVVRAWNRVRSRIDTGWNIAEVRYQQDTTDDRAKAEKQFWDQAAPAMRELDVIHARALTRSRHREALERAFGAQILRVKECTATTFAPEIADALAEEAKLVTRYIELTSKKEAVFRGEKTTMPALHGYFGVADRQTRLDAHVARDRFLAANADDLDDIYDRLVELRDGMGRALGMGGFTPLGYQLMTRIGYDAGDVARFRDAVREQLVPLAEELRRRQAEALGIDEVLLHDEEVLDPNGNPAPTGTPTEILETARGMYRDIDPRLGAFMDHMLEHDLLDVERRDGKAPGGFCTIFADLGWPFVFAQFTGTTDDLQVVTHECGHAYQVWSARKLPLIEYHFPTNEAAEVHSMGMEHLTFPFMERFFGDDAERYRRGHLARDVTALPYITLVDHFQHRVYEQPELTPAQRNAAWLELEASYLPWRRYGDDLPYLATGTIWQRQRHVYCDPFYYIDYALAGVCALQIHMKAERDRDLALRDYLKMCEIGGSVSFTEMLEVGGLRSPFEPEVLADVADHLRRALLS